LDDDSEDRLSPENLGYTIYDQVSNFERLMDTFGITEPKIRLDYFIDHEDVLNIDVSAKGSKRTQYVESRYRLAGLTTEEDRELMYDIWANTIEESASDLEVEEYFPTP